MMLTLLLAVAGYCLYKHDLRLFNNAVIMPMVYAMVVVWVLHKQALIQCGRVPLFYLAAAWFIAIC